MLDLKLGLSLATKTYFFWISRVLAGTFRPTQTSRRHKFRLWRPAEENLRVEKAHTGCEFVSKRVAVSNSSARSVKVLTEMVELKRVMLCESEAQEKSRTSVKVTCTVLGTMIVLVLV